MKTFFIFIIVINFIILFQNQSFSQSSAQKNCTNTPAMYWSEYDMSYLSGNNLINFVSLNEITIQYEGKIHSYIFNSDFTYDVSNYPKRENRFSFLSPYLTRTSK